MFAYPASTTYSLPTGYTYPAGYAAAPVSYNFGLPATTFGYSPYAGYSTFPSQLAFPSTHFSAQQLGATVGTPAAQTQNKIKLTYFDMAGRAEAVRLALYVGGVPFEDERISHSEWNENVKPNARFGQLPLLEVGGKVLAQSYAQLIFVGQLAGLYPEDTWERAKVHEALFLGEDILQTVVPSLREQDPEKKKALRAKFVEELPKYLAFIDKLLTETNTGYLAGPKLTIADINMFTLLQWFSNGTLDDVPTDILSKFARIAEFQQRVASLPRVAEWATVQAKAKAEKEAQKKAEQEAQEKAPAAEQKTEEENKPAAE